MSVVVIGLGNTDRADDAVGTLVVRRLRGRLPPEVPLVEWRADPTGILNLDAWRDAMLAIIVDATSSGARPGTLHRIEVGRDTVPRELGSASTHALGLADTLALASAVDRLPPRVVIVGIEAGRFATGGPPDPAVRSAVEHAADLIIEEVRHGGPTTRARTAPGVHGPGRR